MIKKCLICNKFFYVPQYRKNTAKCCSNKCRHIHHKSNIPWNKNKKMSEAYRNKLSIAHLKTGKSMRKGYVFIHKPNHPFCNASRYVRRSRLVMEQKINRFLKPKEVVHHINSIKDDDRPENLMLFKNNVKHLNFHKLYIARRDIRDQC